MTDTQTEERIEHDGVEKLCLWLEKLCSPTNDTIYIVTECYEARNSPLLLLLTQSTTEGRPRAQIFKDLRHYLGRLGAHRKATKTVVATAVRLPGFLDGFQLEIEPSSAVRLCKLIPDDTVASKIMVRMCPKDGASEYCKALSAMDSTYQLRLDTGLKEHCTFETRVHAEVLLLDLFKRMDYEFVGGDKYIGCSKPACYSCYHYFLAQTVKFTLPACHNKPFLRWRPPDILDSRDINAISSRQDVMNKMNARIRADIKEQLDRRTAPRKGHFDSTTGRSLAIDVRILHGKKLYSTGTEEISGEYKGFCAQS